MTDYERLLEKYEKPYVKGEKRSSEYDNQIKIQAKLKNRMLLVDKLILESKYFYLTPGQKETVKYLVKIFNQDFQTLHRQASDETIILSFIFYLKKLDTPKLQLKDYRITKKYNLTDTIFEVILCRITNYFMLNSSIPVTESYRDDHDSIIKTGDYS